MRVKSFMQKNVVTIKQDQSIVAASMILMKNNITGAPVVDNKNNLVGVISEKDIFKKIYPNYQEYYLLGADKKNDLDIKPQIKEAENIKVKEIMTKDVITAKVTDSSIKIAAIMTIKKINRVIILDNGSLAGIVSRKDIYPQSFKSALENK